MSKLRVLELFSGIGSPRKALERIGIDFEVVDSVDIDKYAVKSYNAVYGEKYEPQSVVDWNKDLSINTIVGGFPCQDVSVAGKGRGIIKGETRSGLMFNMMDIIKHRMPKYVITENVKGLLSKKHRPQFDIYLKFLEDLGYTNHYKVLNAKDYGVPQNRERVICISSLQEDFTFKFPDKIDLELRLKDMLEDEVDEKYYLKKDQLKSLMFNKNWNKKSGDILQVTNLNIRGNEQIRRVYSKEGISPALNTMQGGNRQPKIITVSTSHHAIELPAIVASRGRETEGGVNKQHLELNNSGNSNSITSVQKDNYVAENPFKDDTRFKEYSDNVFIDNDDRAFILLPNNQLARVRKLTPLECWRLMGFDDSDFEKASEVCSNSQLYKQAGNSIVVNVLEAVFKELFKDMIKKR